MPLILWLNMLYLKAEPDEASPDDSDVLMMKAPDFHVAQRTRTPDYEAGEIHDYLTVFASQPGTVINIVFLLFDIRWFEISLFF